MMHLSSSPNIPNILSRLEILTDISSAVGEMLVKLMVELLEVLTLFSMS